MNRQNSLEFRRFILRIANELTSVDREELAYYLSDYIPAGKREVLTKRPSGLFEELERGGYIGPGKLEFLRESLEGINRADLIDKIDFLSPPNFTKKSENCLEHSGYRLRINGEKHLVNDKGNDYVCLQSGQSYELVINNFNDHRCRCKVEIDGHVIFPKLVLEAEGECTLDRPCHTASKFKFFAVKDAPSDSGIDQRNTEENGCIQVTFTPEVTELEIICDIGNGRIRSAKCNLDATDVEFHREIRHEFGCDAATVLIDGYKPLGKRNIKLVDYGIEDGSRVFINFGIIGGVPRRSTFRADERCERKAPEPIQWIPGATTMQGESEQTFERTYFFPNNETRKVVLRLRLIARADKAPLPSKGKCTPFILGNLRPPPV